MCVRQLKNVVKSGSIRSKEGNKIFEEIGKNGYKWSELSFESQTNGCIQRIENTIGKLPTDHSLMCK